MKIKSVNLKNFRQFYGTQQLEFSCDPQKNVTVVHAENTYGKTTLLNSVYWALFENTTAKFENPKNIVSWPAKSDGDQLASVGVEFYDKDNSFLATRFYDQASRKSEFEVSKIVGGNYTPLRTPDDFINTVIPKEMAKYFFFDGEAAEAFSSEKNYKAVGEAIRAILGCSLAERAIEDLKAIDKDLKREIGSKSSDDRLKDLSEFIEKADEFIDEAEGKIENLRAKISANDRLHSTIIASLRDSKAVKKIQEKRDRKENEKTDLEQKIKRCNAKILKWLSKSGTSLLGRRLAEQTREFIDDEETRRKIPSPYNEDLVNSLLADKICICGRELTPGSAEWQTVANLLKDAATSDLVNKISRARSRINSIIEVSKDAHDDLIDLQQDLGALKNQFATVEAEIKSLGQRIENSKIAEIEDKEKARKKLEQKIHSDTKRIGTHESEIKRAKNEKSAAEREFKTLSHKNKLANKLLSRRSLVVTARERLSELLKNYEGEARESIEKEINDILAYVAHNHRVCRFNENFSISLTKYDGTPTPKSSGESQLLSLVFMASLIKYASSRLDDTSLILKPGTVAPLVLDSPFGQLDKVYQTEMATFLPKLAPQLVLFLSSTQGNEKVLEALEPYIGAEYVLLSHSEGDQGKKKVTELIRGGRSIQTKLFSQNTEMTEIVRLDS